MGTGLKKSCQSVSKWSETKYTSYFPVLSSIWSPMDLITTVFYETDHNEGLKLRISWVTHYD